MKKAVSLILICLILVSLCSCFTDSPARAPSSSEPSQATSSEATPEPIETPEPTATPDPTATPERAPEPTPEPAPDLTGEWEQSNKNSETSYQVAYIADDVIEVYWGMEEQDLTALYWVGSYEALTESSESYTWESQGDTEKMSTALLASSDAVKEFTYTNGVLSYSLTAMDTTITVEMEKKDWGYSNLK